MKVREVIGVSVLVGALLVGSTGVAFGATKIDNPSNGNPPPGLTKDKPDNPHFNPGGPGPTP